MGLQVTPLRKHKIYDTAVMVFRYVIWFISLSLFLYVLLVLLLSALRSTAVFSLNVLVLALITISFVFALIFLNVIQRIVFTGLERQRQILLTEFRLQLKSFQQKPNDKAVVGLLKDFLKHPAILKTAAEQELSKIEYEKLRKILIKIGGGDKLENQARNSRRKWRQVEALLLLGWLRPKKNLPVLQDAMYDPDINIISAAANSLIKYSDDYAYQILLEALEAERMPLSRLASFIEFSRCQNKLPPLKQQAESPNAKVRFWTAYLLGKTGRTEALTILASLLKDDDSNVRASAVEAVGRLKDKRSAATIKKYLYDSEWPVRLHASRAVADLQAKELIPDLIELLRDSQWWVRENTALALESFGEDAFPYLKELLSSDDRFARNKAAEILGLQGVVTEQIRKLSASPREAEKAEKFLIDLGRAEALNIIESAAIKANPGTSLKLIKILGEIGNPASAPTLELLAAGNFIPEVKQRAAEVLKIFRRAA